MKKYFIFGLMVAIVPNLCLGASTRYTQLVREKQRKMEELEKCMGATKGLKIAGISTLGLTAVGVAGNIAEAKKKEEYADDIESVPKKMEKIDKEISDLKEKKAQLDANEKVNNGLITDPTEQELRLKLYHDNCDKTGGEIVDGNCVCKDGFSDSWDGTCVFSKADNCYASGGNWFADSKTCDCGLGSVDSNGFCSN